MMAQWRVFWLTLLASLCGFVGGWLGHGLHERHLVKPTGITLRREIEELELRKSELEGNIAGLIQGRSLLNKAWKPTNCSMGPIPRKDDCLASIVGDGNTVSTDCTVK